MSTGDRVACALGWAEGLPRSADPEIVAFVEGRVWGPESGHLAANLLRRRGLRGTVPRFWPDCPAGTGGGRADIGVP